MSNKELVREDISHPSTQDRFRKEAISCECGSKFFTAYYQGWSIHLVCEKCKEDYEAYSG